MRLEPVQGSPLNGRYQIGEKIKGAGDTGPLRYRARDLPSGRTVVIQEIVPSPHLSEDALARRRQQVRDLIALINQFDHSNLCKVLETFSNDGREYVVTEHVEGVSLAKLCDMSVRSLPERQVLDWAVRLCDALSYLHNRPRPLVIDTLSPASLVLTHDDRLWLVDYGIDRFFTQADPPMDMPDSAAETAVAFVAFGRTLGYLLTRQPVADDGGDLGDRLRPELARVVRQCVQSQPGSGYRNFESLRADLQALLVQPPEDATNEGMRDEAAHGRPPGSLNGALGKRRLIWSGATAVTVALGVLWCLAGSAGYSRTGPVGYLLSGTRKIVAVSKGRVVDRISLDFAASDVTGDPGGNWLFVSDPAGNRICRLDGRTHRPAEKAASIAVDRAPTRMAVDDSGSHLYAIHEETCNVSRVDLTRTPPQMSALISATVPPSNLALSPGGRLLFVASSTTSTITILQSDGSKCFGTIALKGSPVAMASTPDSTELWVACQHPDTVAIIDVKAQTVSAVVTDIGGARPVDIAMASNGSKAFVLTQDPGTVGVLTTVGRRLEGWVATGARPQRLIPTLEADRIWVTSMDSEAVDVIDTATLVRCATISVGSPVGLGALLR